MGFFSAMELAGSGLTAQRLRMDVTAENLANAQTTRTEAGGPYRRKDVVLAEGSQNFGTALDQALGGVEVAGVQEDKAAARQVYDPGHPDADDRGYVSMPNVNTVTEMVDLIDAQRAYEANVTAMQAAKQIVAKTIEVLR